MQKRNAFTLIELGIVLFIMLCLFGLMLYLNPPSRMDHAYNACRNGDLDKLKQLSEEGKINEERLPFYLATSAIWGHFELCRYLTEELHAPLTHDELLFNAVASEDERILPYLLEAGAPINVTLRTRHGLNTLLHDSAACGKKSFCETLIKLGAEIDARNESQITALHVAAKRGQEDIFYLLVDAGAQLDVKAKDYRGCTLLHDAAEGGSAKICRDLLQRGAELHAPMKFGATPIHFAAGARDSGACQVLIEAGADIHSPKKTWSGESSNHTPIERSVLSSRTENFKLLAAAGATYDLQRVYSYRTLLQFAASNGDFELFKRFVDEGADLQQNIQGGWTLLHYAARSGNAELCAWLLNKGFDLEAKASYDQTPLLIAADSLKLETCRFLVESGANIEARTTSGKTALDIIIQDERKVDKTALIEFFQSLQND